MRSVAGLCWLAVCASGILGTVDALKCKDASGKDVSWWTALKVPKGYIYGYIEAKQRQDGCVLLYTSTNNPGVLRGAICAEAPRCGTLMRM